MGGGTKVVCVVGLLVAGCGGGGRADGPPDAGPSPDGAGPDAGAADARPLTTSEQIAAARAHPDGATAGLPIDGATVTYVLPAVGDEPAAFTVQADPLGPALLVEVAPASLAPVPAPGDVVSFSVAVMATTDGGARAVAALDGWRRDQVGTSLAELVQFVDGAEVIDDPARFESELISLGLLLTGPLAFVAPQLVEGPVEMGGSGPGLRLRLPRPLQDELQLGRGCSFQLGPVPVLRADDVAVLPMFSSADAPAIGCDGLRVERADALGPTTVRVMFDRALAPASVAPDGSQFELDGAVDVTAAVVSGRDVVLTTSKLAATTYVVSTPPGGALADVHGEPVAAGYDHAAFDAGAPIPQIQINEVNATQGGGCDLVELRVRTAGNLRGHVLRAGRQQVLAAFDELAVAADDAIVIHLRGDDPGCNPDGHTVERSYPAEATGPGDRNFATAFDWWASGDADLPADELVLVLEDPRGELVDAVLLDDDLADQAGATAEVAAAEVGEARAWLEADGTPADAFRDAAFRAAAAIDLDATSTDRSSSLQRLDDLDRDRRADWTVAAATWGQRNAGQPRAPAPSSFGKHVLLEMFTGTWCMLCTDGYAYASALRTTYGERLVTLNLHTVSPGLDNPDADARISAYNPPGYPTGGIDSDTSAPLSRASWAAAVAGRAALTPRCGLTIDARDPTAATVRVACASEPLGALRLQLWLVQREQLGPDQPNFYDTTPGHAYEGAGNPIVDFPHAWIARSNLVGDVHGQLLDGALAAAGDLEISAAVPTGVCAGECWIVGTLTEQTGGVHVADNTRRGKVGTVTSWD